MVSDPAVDLTPALKAAEAGEYHALNEAMRLLTDEALAHLCDVGEFIKLSAGLALSARLAAKAGTDEVA